VRADVYLLVNHNGTKTKQWVIVWNGEAFPTIFINREVAVQMAEKLTKMTGRGERNVFWEIAECELVDDIASSISVVPGKCPLGRMWTGGNEIGFYACPKCAHLKRDMGGGAARLGSFHKARARWECGQLLQEVMVARKLADR